MSKLAECMRWQHVCSLDRIHLGHTICCSNMTFRVLRTQRRSHSTLSLIDASSIPISKLIAFRKREDSETRGRDYREMRHRYADAIAQHVETTKSVRSANELKGNPATI